MATCNLQDRRHVKNSCQRITLLENTPAHHPDSGPKSRKSDINVRLDVGLEAGNDKHKRRDGALSHRESCLLQAGRV